MSARWRRSVAPVVLAATVLAAAGTAACGVPVGGGPTHVPADEVPFGLAEPPTSSPAPASPLPGEDQPRVYLLAADGSLAPRGRTLAAGTPPERLAELLADLARGPSERERDEGLSTALDPTVAFTVAGIDGTTATVGIDGLAEAPSGRETRSAVGQVVLTASSLPGVRAVVLTRDGEPVEAPLPSGELTAAPLTAADYGELLTAPASPTS